MGNNLFSDLVTLASTAHLFSEHVGFTPQKKELRRVGPIQYVLHWVYAVLEPPLLRFFNRLLKTRWITETRPGRAVLNTLLLLAFAFPHSICVSLEAAERFIDHIENTEGPKGARIGVGPCVCQRALGCRKEPYMKDMVILYGADIYYHLNVGYRLISGEEAKAILRECDKAGLVHNLDLCMRSGKYVFVICNCDNEICPLPPIYRLTGKIIWPGPEIIRHHASLCLGKERCGRCFARCIFDVNREVNGRVVVDYAKCMGCGLCVSTCMGHARTMAVREDYRHDHHVPASLLLG
jgi:NAD-dependent dihydropyrimidine dehydrogenase PreA subunit